MINFCNELYLKWHRNSIYFELTAPFNVEIDALLISVPKGFKTDLASIPLLLRFIVDKDDSVIREAAVIHDYLYDITCDISISRKDSDNILKALMIYLNMDNWKVNLIYLIVRVFGSKFYKK